MITQQLINPQSIAVVGGSNNINKPGGQRDKDSRHQSDTFRSRSSTGGYGCIGRCFIIL